MIPCDSCKHFDISGPIRCTKYRKNFDNGFHARNFAEAKGCR